MKTESRIFRNASSTFYISSLFFPREIRRDVFDLYSFVRVADDYVDSVPAGADGFYHFRSLWEQAVRNPDFDTEHNDGDTTDTRVIKNMMRVSRKYNFEPEWMEAFLDTMQSDLRHKKFRTAEDLSAYAYGSGEVIGLMMARVMKLPPEAESAAMTQGRAMQMINFIRDIEEDNRLGRQYLPQVDLEMFNLPDLSRETALSRPADFKKFIQYQIKKYEGWQADANEGFGYIPKRLRIPIETAAGMYAWTAGKIVIDPPIVYKGQVRPSQIRLICYALTKII